MNSICYDDIFFSSDVGEREAEKARLQKQFLESDQRLDGLVAG